MADDSHANVPSQGRSASSREVTGGVKPATSWLLPVITAVVLASAFCVYYFVYVAAQREYLANRNFRSLAMLGDQIQAMVSIHSSILEFSAHLADPTRNHTNWKKEGLKQFVVVRPEDKLKESAEQEALKDYVKYLAPGFELTEIPLEKQSGSRLEVQRRNGRWELALTSQKHAGSQKGYLGSLEFSGALNPLVGSLPFDDILLVSENGTIVYQSNKAGPQFTTLTGLLQAQPGAQETKPAGSAADTRAEGSPAEAHTGLASGHDHQKTHERGAINLNADQTWRTRSMHLTDVKLAGTDYKLFLQPVLVDVFSDEPSQDEPAQEWVLCGLRSVKTLEWEALSISSSLMLWLTALFFVVLMSGPVLKVLFINRREHLRLRELAFLGLFLVLLTSVFTLSGLNAVGFPLNDDTEEELQRLGNNLSNNIHDELRQMREQLQAWCSDSGLLQKDLESVQGYASPRRARRDHAELPEQTGSRSGREVIRSSKGGTGRPPTANHYPYLNNVFWTDDEGQQIVKWSPSGYLTPMIDVSQSRLYTQPQSTYVDDKAPEVHFDSIMPPNKLEYLAALTMSTADCNPDLLRHDIRSDLTSGTASLTAEPLSLIDPILPFGYGFALFDQTGLVLFHANKTKNVYENFLQESDWNKQLYAAAIGHSTQRSLPVKYLGSDYQARVMPVTGVSQAPLSLVIYRDLTFVRTLNLQSMTMTSMLLLAILAVPAIAIAIWSAIRRPQFAPEWLWPNQARMSTYVYQIVIYAFLIILFLFLGFTGSSEQNVIACVAVPYTAFLLTAWCIRAQARPEAHQIGKCPEMGSLPNQQENDSAEDRHHSKPGAEPSHSPRRNLLLALLDRSRGLLAVRLNRFFHRKDPQSSSPAATEVGSYAWRRCYVLSVVLLLVLVGVLTPMALFRASLNVERRLGIKQAQLHLASAVDRRLMSIRERCKDNIGVDQLGVDACSEFEKASAAWSKEECESSAWSKEEFEGKERTGAWSKIALDSRFLKEGKLPVCPHLPQKGGELYSGWFQNLVYALHLDYNQTAAETLGIIADRLDSKSGSVPEWSWKNEGSMLTLRWHGVHSRSPKSNEPENDLLITSIIPASSRVHAFAGVAVAASVIVAIGLIVWALARRIFLFHVAPLKMTGALRAAESIREGRNVFILVPRDSDWHLEARKWTLDLEQIATGPKWAEDFDLETVPVGTVIEVQHFEDGSNDPELNKQKSILLKRLLERENTQLAVIMVVAASSEDYGRMFPAFELIDLREEPFYWLKQYEGPARDLIWKECCPMAALWPIGAQLAKDIKAENIHSEETIISEILERADGYYRLVWKESSNDQKFALAQLAEDGLLNPANGRAIRQLVRKGLITTDPQFRLMNESFRRFLRSATPAALKQDWLRESRRSGWGKMHGAFFTTMILLGAFALTTQNALWQSSAAYVTTALGALGTLAKLFNAYRGGGTTEKTG
jgi:hypothetical protein